MNALLTGCVIDMVQKMVVLLLSMVKRFVDLMIKAVDAEQYMLSVHLLQWMALFLDN